MDKQAIKEAIWKYEYYRNGFNHLSGVDVEIKNLKLFVGKAVADIILHTDLEEGTCERYNHCEYDYKILGF